MAPKRQLLEERLDWLASFPVEMTVGDLLRTMRFVKDHLAEAPNLPRVRAQEPSGGAEGMQSDTTLGDGK